MNSSKSQNRKTGMEGELIARQYLENLGYKILDTNVHLSVESEIDIIAKDGDVIVFVEVKTRKSLSCGHPFEAVTKNKLSKIVKGAYMYMNKNGAGKAFRIDVVSVLGTVSPKIEHLKNIEI